MTSSFVTDLRNVDWEIYTIYSEGLASVKRDTLEFLWCEVDRLEGLIAGQSDG